MSPEEKAYAIFGEIVKLVGEGKNIVFSDPNATELVTLAIGPNAIPVDPDEDRVKELVDNLYIIFTKEESEI